MVGTSFVPSQLTIAVGDTVRWVNVSGSHDVESDEPLFKSPPPPVSTYQFTFTQAGRFTYRCNPHAFIGMTGVITVEEAAANQPPTVSISAPAEGASFTPAETVTVEAQAADSDGSIAKVDFFSNGNLVGTANTSPFSTALQGLRPGNYALTATATDNAGATATSAAVNITVAAVVNAPPTVAITAPTEGAAFTAPASVAVTADANDTDGGIAKVDFFANGNLVGTAATAPFSAMIEGLAAGNYALTAVATDTAGATATSDAVNIVVNPAAANAPPTISITSPTTGQILAAPATVILEATAADSDGSVSEVAFFRVTNPGAPPPAALEPLGAVTALPYTLTLSDLPAGEYHLVAQATDNAGAKTLSGEVVVTVQAGIRIESITRAGGETVLRVRDTTPPGQLAAQASADLTTWTDVAGTFTPVEGGMLELREATAAEVRFYRVQIKAPPPG
jgi:hypothetical protein